jgi:hypothetical protein
MSSIGGAQMARALDYPLLVLVASLTVFWLSAQIGSWLRKRRRRDEGVGEDFTFLLGATLTLLGLIIGFTFSMAVGRYDQRKNYEEQEANAIGTEYVRADLMPAADAARVRGLLRSYLDRRMVFYTSRDERQLREVDAEAARLQAEMWSVVQSYGSAQPTAVSALVVSGMNDVLNSQGYTQAAWWNRIPIGAWLLMVAIAIFCNLLVGYGAHGRHATLFLILPVALSITLFLIAEIDSPRTGLIRVGHQNLQAVVQSLNAP